LRSERMIKYLPVYERNAKIFQSLINVKAQEMDKKALDIEDFINQLSIDTATWGLDIYENELGINTNINKSYEERRSFIKSKYRGIGKFDKALLQSILKSYTNGETEVSFNGKFNLLLEYIENNTLNLVDLETTLEEIKPAHLDYTLALKIKDKIAVQTTDMFVPVVFPICNQLVAGGEFL